MKRYAMDEYFKIFEDMKNKYGLKRTITCIKPKCNGIKILGTRPTLIIVDDIDTIAQIKAREKSWKCKHMYLEDYKLTIPKCNICGHEKYSRDGLGKAKGRDCGK